MQRILKVTIAEVEVCTKKGRGLLGQAVQRTEDGGGFTEDAAQSKRMRRGAREDEDRRRCAHGALRSAKRRPSLAPPARRYHL